MTDLLILTDGGTGIGFGHLMRCLAIKNAWNNGDVTLLAQMEGGESLPDGAVYYKWLDTLMPLEQFTSTNTVVLVDSYRPNADYFRLLKSMFPFVAVLDDYNRISYPVDLVICPGVYGKEMDYCNQVGVTAGGPEYVIIRPEILAVQQIAIRDTVETVLVTFGGSQQDETLLQKMVDLLEEAGYQMIIVTGNDQLAKNLSAKTSRIYGRVNPMAMAELMASVDVAISAAGQTLNELSWLGVPTLSFKTGEDQQGNWEYYNRHNLSLAALVPDEPNLNSVLRGALISETVDRRLKKSKKLKNLLTTTGAEAICSLIEEMGKKVNE